ncbi:MAG: YbaK/EbsC family protein [Patescibacteria group bacterium]
MSLELLDPLVKQALDTYDIKAKAIECNPELADTADFCAHYGFALDQSANTIIVASRTEPIRFSACLVLAATKLDVNKKVRELMGIRKLSFATAGQTKELTGMLIGGVTIVGLPDIPIYIDKEVMERSEVIVGGGNRSSKLVLNPAELRKLPDSHIIDGLGIARQ